MISSMLKNEPFRVWHGFSTRVLTGWKPAPHLFGALLQHADNERSSRWIALLFAVWLMLPCPSAFAQATSDPQAENPEAHSVNPLSLKEQMIRDRYERFEDRLFHIREQLEAAEPDNAARLARALHRAGELGLAEQLDEIVELLNDPSSLGEAIDAQRTWLEGVDRLLAILLEQDSENEERKREIDRLEAYRETLRQILDEQRGLRDASGQESMKRRMIEQLDQALRRIDSLSERQGEASDRTLPRGGPAAPSGGNELVDEQRGLARQAGQLAEDLQRLSQLRPEPNADTPVLQGARSEVQDAANSVQNGAEAMSKAVDEIEQDKRAAATEDQQQAQEFLRKARASLENAKRALESEQHSRELSEEQQEVAKRTGDLSAQMRDDQASGDQPGSPGEGSGQPPPGGDRLDQAQDEMHDAARGLGAGETEDAARSQDRAIDQLEQARRELEDELHQRRKEDREEALRDLEVRFREMLSKQRAINESTKALDDKVGDAFERVERLEAADLSTSQRALSDQAATCLHILDEEGTTIVFPHVVGQLAEDMAEAATRLGALKVGTLTQTIQKEILDTLEQLLEATKKMQQENEQQMAPNDSGGDDRDSPLLPASAELKLLRASQFRVNTRTVAIEEARAEQTESSESLARSISTASKRQKECAEIAAELRDRQHGH